MQIGRKIKKIRNAKGITRKKLAERSKIPYQTLDNIESGRVAEPKLDTLYKICQALSITIDSLYTGKQTRTFIPEEITDVLQNARVKYFLKLVAESSTADLNQIKKLCNYLLSITAKK